MPPALLPKNPFKLPANKLATKWAHVPYPSNNLAACHDSMYFYNYRWDIIYAHLLYDYHTIQYPLSIYRSRIRNVTRPSLALTTSSMRLFNLTTPSHVSREHVGLPAQSGGWHASDSFPASQFPCSTVNTMCYFYIYPRAPVLSPSALSRAHPRDLRYPKWLAFSGS